MVLVNILMMDDGQVKMAVPEGDFIEGSNSLRALIVELQASDIPIVPDGPVEQHKHSAERAHVHPVTGVHKR